MILLEIILVMSTLYFDEEDPEINLIYPNDGEKYIRLEEINYTVLDANANSCFYNLNGVNSSIVSAGTNFSLEASKGEYNITVYCTDNVGNIGASQTINVYNYDIRGDPLSIDYFGNGADGEFIFTTETKSYGNLVLGSDYQVSGNTVYLALNRAFNFTNFTVGTGMTIKPLNSSGAVLFIRTLENYIMNGTYTLNLEKLLYFWASWSFFLLLFLLDLKLFLPLQLTLGLWVDRVDL